MVTRCSWRPLGPYRPDLPTLSTLGYQDTFLARGRAAGGGALVHTAEVIDASIAYLVPTVSTAPPAVADREPITATIPLR